MSTISFAITAHNEHIELKRLVDQLDSFIKPEDEIIVQLDSTATKEVQEIAMSYGVGSKYEKQCDYCKPVYQRFHFV